MSTKIKLFVILILAFLIRSWSINSLPLLTPTKPLLDTTPTHYFKPVAMNTGKRGRFILNLWRLQTRRICLSGFTVDKTSWSYPFCYSSPQPHLFHSNNLVLYRLVLLLTFDFRLSLFLPLF